MNEGCLHRMVNGHFKKFLEPSCFYLMIVVKILSLGHFTFVVGFIVSRFEVHVLICFSCKSFFGGLLQFSLGRLSKAMCLFLGIIER